MSVLLHRVMALERRATDNEPGEHLVIRRRGSNVVTVCAPADSPSAQALARQLAAEGCRVVFREAARLSER